MWVIRWIFIVAAVIFLIGFAMQNASVTVPIKFYKWETVNELPLWLVMYASFAAGMVFWLIISIVQVLSLRKQARQAEKRAEKLQAELKRLRNVSVEDAMIPEKTSSSSQKESSND